MGGIAWARWADGADFTPTTTASGTPLRWAGGCVFLRPHVAGTLDVPGALETALATATAAWEAPTRSCSYLDFQIEPAEAGEVGRDNVNRIIVREDKWCRPGTPEKCYDAGAVAITTVFYVDDPGDPRDGTIIDADIELNAVHFALATCDGQPGGCTSGGDGPRQDLANILTHELGHLIGLDHTCWAGFGTQPRDGNNVPIPPCQPSNELPASVVEATMFNFANPEEIIKRTPEADDVDGFCTRYPLASDPGTCEPVPAPIDAEVTVSTGGGGGCCSSSSAVPPLWLVFGVAVIQATLRRIRRS